MKGIDISKHNGKIDFQKVKESGIEFAILRCGYGKDLSQKDSMFEEYYRECRKVGIKVGTYLYSYCTEPNNAILEADNALRFIEGKEFEMGVYYDMEDKKCLSMGRINITRACQLFCDKIREAGYKSGIYANLNWFNNYIDINKVNNNIIWLAQWSNYHTENFKIDMWQFTSNGQINGINGRVDLNEAFFIPESNNINNSNKKSNEEISEEVIKGLWGNQPERQERLEKAGYNYQEIQNLVNNKLQKNSEIIYIVKENDTLTKIARKYKTTIKKLVEDNNIKDKNLIKIGQKIKILK